MAAGRKAKSKAVVLVADGSGGMTQVEDRRFEQGEWPIRFDVPSEQAETWLLYFHAECGRRNWSSNSFGQIDGKENSGSVNVGTGTGEQFSVVWERRRGKPIKVRSRSLGKPELPLDQLKAFFDEVSSRCASGYTEPFFRGGQLRYQGLPWRGELWLDPKLRLGPPSKQDERALIGPRIILVNAIVDGIDWMHAGSAFDLRMQELSVFLTVTLGKHVAVAVNGGRGWTWATDETGKVTGTESSNLGYWELQWPESMPVQGQVSAVPLKTVNRPDFSLRGIDGTQSELHVPHDILDLWQAYLGLSCERRQQFQQVGNMCKLALSLGHEYSTARFAWMVAACESLKPGDRQYRNHNIYHVVESLLGKQSSALLQEHWFRPQDVRNAHLHRGEFRGDEFIHRLMHSSFQDPTFDQAARELYLIAQESIIEWLRRGGVFGMPTLNRKTSTQRWIKDRAFYAIAVMTGVGFLLGWLLTR